MSEQIAANVQEYVVPQIVHVTHILATCRVGGVSYDSPVFWAAFQLIGRVT